MHTPNISLRISFPICTQGGSFRCHFVFELNEHTWAWIAEYPDTDCFTGLLEDLALYKNGEIKLSCCSHEELYEEITVPLPPPKGLI